AGDGERVRQQHALGGGRAVRAPVEIVGAERAADGVRLELGKRAGSARDDGGADARLVRVRDFGVDSCERIQAEVARIRPAGGGLDAWRRELAAELCAVDDAAGGQVELRGGPDEFIAGAA